MKLTIITPVLNGEAVIERAIQSVRRQHRREAAGQAGDWEHLVVDGGSRDRTVQILRRHPHLRWTSETDRGVFDAMNKGIARARGEWIYFLGADDVLHSQRVLERILPELVEPWDAVYGDVVGPRFAGRYDGPFDERRLLRRNICHQALFLRRRLFERLGDFDLRYPVNADWEHNLRWFFDPATRARYLDLVVADFAEGGLSGVGDQAWRRDRRFTYLRHAHAALPRTRSLALLLREVSKACRTGNLERVRACLSLAPRVARGERVPV